MSPQFDERALQAPPRAASITVCVQHHPRGHWEVIVPDRRARISCETFEDARRMAYLTVAHAHDCELIVRDAYNRVVQHQLIDGHQPVPIASRSRVSRRERVEEVSMSEVTITPRAG